jgi:hypothetical protein
MAKIRTGDIAIDGLADLSRTLKRFDTDLAKTLRDANREAATIAASAAKSRATAAGGSLAKGAPTITASAGYAWAGLGFGGPRAPWMPGAEFGANRDRQRQRSTGTYIGYRQFQPWRGSDRNAGYAIYPAIRASADRVVESYADGLDSLFGRIWSN